MGLFESWLCEQNYLIIPYYCMSSLCPGTELSFYSMDINLTSNSNLLFYTRNLLLSYSAYLWWLQGIVLSSCRCLGVCCYVGDFDFLLCCWLVVFFNFCERCLGTAMWQCCYVLYCVYQLNGTSLLSVCVDHMGLIYTCWLKGKRSKHYWTLNLNMISIDSSFMQTKHPPQMFFNG